MSIKTRVAVLERLAKEKSGNSIDGPQPPIRTDYVRENGAFNHDGYRSAAARWSVEVFGKPLALVAEGIAEREGF